jgi:hypothetical protein
VERPEAEEAESAEEGVQVVSRASVVRLLKGVKRKAAKQQSSSELNGG